MNNLLTSLQDRLARPGATTYLMIAVVVLVTASSSVLAAGPKSFGEPLQEGTVTVRLGELMEQPLEFVGKRLRVEGLVEDVCPMKGCWIKILEEQSNTTIRFKVQDDVIVFPAEAKGHEVVAEGILRAKQLDQAAARSWFKHLAEEKGEDFDESTIQGSMTIYEIEGIGAELGD